MTFQTKSSGALQSFSERKMSPKMTHYHVSLFLLLQTIVQLATGMDSQRNLEESFRAHRKHGAPGLEYSEYTDYDTKLHHLTKTMNWNNSPAAGRESMSQLATSSRGSEHKNVQANSASSNVKLVPNWPEPNEKIGQVAAVDIDINGNVVIFHRADRIWGSETFSYSNIYQERSSGPIQQNPVVVFHPTSGQIIEEWGSNLFYLPHGLTVDYENNIWITDVALHQVYKFSANRTSSGTPSLVLGEKFVPGNDNAHFCKPTDVAVSTNGDFFVSDGYCNSRIIKYDKTGKKLMEWGRSTLSAVAIGQKPPPDHFLIPHALAIAEENSTLFVADRENGRVQCFNTSTGVYIRQLHSQSIGPRIFSVAYAPVHGGLLYIVNGPVVGDTSVKVEGFVVSLISEEFVAHFNSDGYGFKNPHDIAVTKDGSQIYVAELNPNKVWKFVQGHINTTSRAISPHIENASSLGNTTNTLENTADSKVSSNAAAAASSSLPSKVHFAQSNSSVVATIAAIASVTIVIIIAVTVIILRIRKGPSKDYAELDMYYN